MNENLIKIHFRLIQIISTVIFIIITLIVLIFLPIMLIDKMIIISVLAILYSIVYVTFRPFLIIDLQNKIIEYRSYLSKRGKCSFSDIDKIIIKIAFIIKETRYEKRQIDYRFTIVRYNKRVLSFSATDITQYSLSLKLDRVELFNILKENFNVEIINNSNIDLK